MTNKNTNRKTNPTDDNDQIQTNATPNPTPVDTNTNQKILVIDPTDPTNMSTSPPMKTNMNRTILAVRQALSPSDLTNTEHIGETPRKPTSSSVAHVVRVPSSQNNEKANYVLTDIDRDGVSGLSDSQWRSMVNLLNANTEKLIGKISVPFWIMDTGASHHLTGKFNILTNVRDIAPVMIILAYGRERISVKEGTVKLGHNLILHSVFYVEEMHSDLISLGKLMDENHCVVQLADHFLVVQDRSSRMIIGAGKRVGGTFYFRSMETAASVTMKDEKSFELWHKRMGYPSSTRVVGLLPKLSVSVSSENLKKACDVCLRAKQTRDCFPVSLSKTSQIFELIHCDIWGAYRTPSHSGARYFLTIVDVYSRGVWLYLLNEKSEAHVHLRNFFSMTERQFQSQIQTVRSDNGSEFLCLTEFFQKNEVGHETSCVGTPQQNGRVERKHRHILNVARALRFQANLPIEFWGECVLMAGYLINRTPSSVLDGATPYERLHKKIPQYDHLRVFGSLCYAHSQTRGDKFVSRSRMMGYKMRSFTRVKVMLRWQEDHKEVHELRCQRTHSAN